MKEFHFIKHIKPKTQDKIDHHSVFAKQKVTVGGEFDTETKQLRIAAAYYNKKDKYDSNIALKKIIPGRIDKKPTIIVDLSNISENNKYQIIHRILEICKLILEGGTYRRNIASILKDKTETLSLGGFVFQCELTLDEMNNRITKGKLKEILDEINYRVKVWKFKELCLGSEQAVAAA